jgi:hypothetical protein
MKVYIGPYKNYIGPYHIAKKLLFWMDEYGDTVYKFGGWLAKTKDNKDTWLTKFCQWLDNKRSKKVSVRIDNYDMWNMDSTLAYIILPMLRKLAEDKPGAPFVDLEDVPEHLRVAEPTDDGVDSTWFARWEYVLNEMIFAFENINSGWEDQFWNTTPTTDSLHHSNGYECDWDARKAYDDRIQNGLRLFGKYYRGLWT